ncbi:Hypothetical protein A7982_00687 [Minicystis rosea]|nr:Hypothetical protein A7982_00687 [Minicystis rosea]
MIVTTRLHLAALALLLGATVGCNLILGTEPPLPLGTGGSAASTGTSGGCSIGGAPTMGPPPCGDAEWTHWNPTAPHDYTTKQGCDGTTYVIDALTRLAWQTPAPPDKSAVTWADADAYCKGLTWGGFQGWRLPTLVELASLTLYEQASPSLDTTAFPDAKGGDFWTGTDSDYFSNSVYIVSQDDGHIDSRKAENMVTASVQCVRDLKPAADTSCVRYTLVDGDEAVQDQETGLIWQREQSIGTKMWKNEQAQYEAKDACAALTLAGRTWRLPKVSELVTLLAITATNNPSGLDPQFFGNDQPEPGDYYWTATAQVGNTNHAWGVDMTTFVTVSVLNTNENYVRCVR